MRETATRPTTQASPAPHSLALADRKKATLTGVTKVDSSNASELVMTTTLGKLEIRGSDLKITRFDEASGDLVFTGNVDGIKYATAKPPILKRIFK